MKNREDLNLVNLTANDVAKVYSGKPGCTCGCNGNYYCTPHGKRYDWEVENAAQVTRVINILKNNGLDVYRYGTKGELVNALGKRYLSQDSGSIPSDCPFICFDSANGKRTYAIYLNAYS